MKANSLSFKVVKSVFQKNEKCPSYDALNDHRYSKNDKVKYLKAHFWEAITAIRMKLLWDIYDHQGYPYTKFHPILRGSFAKVW